MTLLYLLDLLSTFVFALVGARVAADKGLDYGGIAFIAAIASVSGGTLRNVFLGLKPIWWLIHGFRLPSLRQSSLRWYSGA